MSEKQQSWFSKTLGRSLFSLIFGNFFEKKNNVSSLIALILVLAGCYVVVIQQKSDYIPYLFNILFVVIGYYFVKRQGSVNDEDE